MVSALTQRDASTDQGVMASVGHASMQRERAVQEPVRPHRLQLDGRDDDAQQQPRPEAVGPDEERVLADAAEPRALRVLPLEDRRGVDARPEPLAGMCRGQLRRE
jgi:hypothetical protein